MSRLLRLVLTLSVSGTLPSYGFLVAPQGAPGSASHVLRRRPRVEPSWPTGRPARARTPTPIGCPRWHTMSAATGDTSTDNNNNEADRPPVSSSSAGKIPPRKRRTPRKHVPVADSPTGARESPNGPGVGSGAWPPGVGPFAGGEAQSLLPEPTHQERVKFNKIMEDVLGVENEEELPSTLSPHLAFLLSVDVPRLTNDLISQEPTLNRVQTLRNAYDFVVTFLEGMVESALEMQKENRNTLREIIETAKIGPDEFEKKMKKLQDRFTYEFVKYLDAEVERLEKGDKTPGPGGGNEVLNVIKVVRTRVCAQVDLTMGEDVALLTRLLSYDDRYMMRAALKGVLKGKFPYQLEAFTKLVSITLKDVTEMGGGVDPQLRRKLTDMAHDVELITREAKETKEAIAAEEAEEANN